MTNWEKFHLGIGKQELYNEDDRTVDGLLMDMGTQSLIHVGM